MHIIYSVSTDSLNTAAAAAGINGLFLSQPIETWRNLAQSTRLAEEPRGKSLFSLFDLNLLKFCHAE